MNCDKYKGDYTQNSEKCYVELHNLSTKFYTYCKIKKSNIKYCKIKYSNKNNSVV